MGKLLITEQGKIRDASDVELAERVIELKQQKDLWAVIDELIKAWSERTPDEVQALKIELEDHREGLEDKQFGQTSGGKDFERRFTLVFPQSLQLMIRALYKADEVPFDSKFYKDFAARYPFFKVAEEV